MENFSDLANDFLQSFSCIQGYAGKFSPGISRLDVENFLGLSEDLLPEDFFLLYEWRNGYIDFRGDSNFNLESFAPFHFNTIEVVSMEKGWDWCKDNPPTYDGSEILPFVSGDSLFWGIIIGSDYGSDPHIVYVDETGEAILRYDSITTMLKTIVQCFQLGALYFDDGFIEKNNKLFAEILTKNNPKTLLKAVSKFEDNIDFYGSNLDNETYKNNISNLWNSLNILEYMRPPEIIERCKSRLIELQALSSQRAINACESLKEWIDKND